MEKQGKSHGQQLMIASLVVMELVGNDVSHVAAALHE